MKFYVIFLHIIILSCAQINKTHNSFPNIFRWFTPLHQLDFQTVHWAYLLLLFEMYPFFSNELLLWDYMNFFFYNILFVITIISIYFIIHLYCFSFMFHYLKHLSSLINKGKKKKRNSSYMSKLGICNFLVILLKCSPNSQFNFPLARSEKRLWSLQSNPTCEKMRWKEGQGRKETAVLTSCGWNTFQFFKFCKAKWPCEHMA